ncbi:hypothetical protein [Umezawaea sp.]|uniref:hypothetical protein n=1 Tax=Umezawaea sp. TaxID=1955258 RepID=UPI002ED0EB9D
MIGGREVWAEVEPFMLLGRTGAVPREVRAAPRPAVPFAAAAAALAVPVTGKPVLELVEGDGGVGGARSSAELVLVVRVEEQA